jgi:hypothetical protein
MRFPTVVIALLVHSAACASVESRFFAPSTTASGIVLDEIPSAARGQLNGVDELLRGRRWSEAARQILAVLDEHGNRLLPRGDAVQGFQQYVSLFEHVATVFDRLPESVLPVLHEYQQLVDPVASDMYTSARRRLQPDTLSVLAREFAASQYGALAKDLLAELALERGDYAGARHLWQSLLAAQHTRPDQLAPAVLSARLALVSILEGNLDGAIHEISQLETQFPGCKGSIAGRTGLLADILRDQLEAARSWPQINEVSYRFMESDVKELDLAWRVDLPEELTLQPRRRSLPATSSLPSGLPRGWHVPGGVIPPPASLSQPLVIDSRVFLASDYRLLAFRSQDGRPLPGASAEGVIFSDPALHDQDPRSVYLGKRQMTLSAQQSLLLARLGSPVTVPISGSPSADAPSQVIGIDSTTLKLVFRVDKPKGGWTFEGNPITDGEQVYCCLRRSSARPELHVAAFDLATGRMNWQTMIAAAATLGAGIIDEITHASLVLHQGQLLCSSQSGVIASIRTDGMLDWVTTYPRDVGELRSADAWHRFRLSSPCVPDHDDVYVIPNDFAGAFCLDLKSGGLRWANQEIGHEFDAWQILAVTGNHLIAGGRRLWWLDRHTGEPSPVAENPFPQNLATDGTGCGLGVVHADLILWPARTNSLVIHRLSVRDGERLSSPLRIRSPLSECLDLFLTPNLIIGCSASQLVALSPHDAE